MVFRAPQDQPSQSPELTPLNVALAFLFVVFDSVLSVTLGLGIASSLLVAASRCILQLSIMGLVLEKVFETGNIFGVFGIAGMSVRRVYSELTAYSCKYGEQHCSMYWEPSRPHSINPKDGLQTWQV